MSATGHSRRFGSVAVGSDLASRRFRCVHQYKVICEGSVPPKEGLDARLPPSADCLEDSADSVLCLEANEKKAILRLGHLIAAELDRESNQQDAADDAYGVGWNWPALAQ